MTQTVSKTPGYNRRLSIFFAFDKNNCKRAYRWEMSQLRAFPMKLAEAENLAASEAVDLLPEHPFKQEQ